MDWYYTFLFGAVFQYIEIIFSVGSVCKVTHIDISVGCGNNVIPCVTQTLSYSTPLCLRKRSCLTSLKLMHHRASYPCTCTHDMRQTCNFMHDRISRPCTFIQDHISHPCNFNTNHISHSCTFIHDHISHHCTFILDHISHPCIFIHDHISHPWTFIQDNIAHPSTSVQTISHILIYLYKMIFHSLVPSILIISHIFEHSHTIIFHILLHSYMIIFGILVHLYTIISHILVPSIWNHISHPFTLTHFSIPRCPNPQHALTFIIPLSTIKTAKIVFPFSILL